MSESGTSGSVPTPSTAFSSFLPVYITTSRHDTQPTQQTPHTTTIYTQSTYSAVPSDPTTKLPVGAIAGGVSAGVVLALLVTAGWIYWGRAIDKSVAKHRKEDEKRKRTLSNTRQNAALIKNSSQVKIALPEESNSSVTSSFSPYPSPPEPLSISKVSSTGGDNTNGTALKKVVTFDKTPPVVVLPPPPALSSPPPALSPLPPPPPPPPQRTNKLSKSRPSSIGSKPAELNLSKENNIYNSDLNLSSTQLAAQLAMEGSKEPLPPLPITPPPAPLPLIFPPEMLLAVSSSDSSKGQNVHSAPTTSLSRSTSRSSSKSGKATHHQSPIHTHPPLPIPPPPPPPPPAPVPTLPRPAPQPAQPAQPQPSQSTPPSSFSFLKSSKKRKQSSLVNQAELGTIATPSQIIGPSPLRNEISTQRSSTITSSSMYSTASGEERLSRVPSGLIWAALGGSSNNSEAGRDSWGTSNGAWSSWSRGGFWNKGRTLPNQDSINSLRSNQSNLSNAPSEDGNGKIGLAI